MKSKELIKLLEQQDPEGGLDVVVGSNPISSVQNLPGYYDGRFLKQIYKNGSLVGAKYCSTERKLVIDTWDLDCALLNNPDLPVDCSEAPHYQSRVEQIRLDNIKILDNIERQAFNEFVKLMLPNNNIDNLDACINDWYDKLGLSWRDKLPKYPDYGLSTHDRRLNGWKERFEVLIENSNLVIKEKINAN